MPLSRRDLPALVFALVVVAVAPFMGLVRDALFATFGDAAVPKLAGVLAVAGVAFALFAIARTWRRPLGLLGVGVALGLVWLQIAGFSTGVPKVDVVEQIHIFEYGGLAILLWASRPRHETQASWADLGRVLLGVVLLAVADEGVQWAFQLRVGEIRDVGLDLAAGVAGLVFAVSVWPPGGWRGRSSREELIQLADGSAVATAALGMFFGFAHLGHIIDDPEIGSFRSFHSPTELRREADDRARRWGEAPPTGLVAWHLEDRFLSEAAKHANHRNSALAAGDLAFARQANLILERWFDPFLDITSFRGAGRHRWPEDLRQRVEREAPPVDPTGYLSPVLAGRVAPWPAAPYWLVVVVATLGFWTLGRWLGSTVPSSRSGSIAPGDAAPTSRSHAPPFPDSNPSPKT